MTSTDATVTRSLPSGEQLTLSRHGAQVLRWSDAAGRPLLYLSPLDSAPGAGRRGGVPVCFPQFSGRGSLPKHGFARGSDWVELPDGGPETIRLRLQDSPASLALWPHRFTLELEVRLAPQELTLALQVRNDGDQPWSFTGALHTYFRVDAIASTRVHGLRGLTYEDARDDCRLCIDDEPTPDLSRPVDRVYRGATAPLTLQTPMHTLQVSQTGFEDVVVWNPGAELAAALPDLPADDWRVMLCVEAAQASRPVTVPAGSTWQGSQTLRLLPP